MTQNKDRRHRRKGPLTPLQWVLTLSLGLVVLLITGCSVALAAGKRLPAAFRAENGALSSSMQVDSGEFHYGVYVDDISLGGLTMDQALAKVKLAQEKLIHETSVRLYYEDQEVMLPLSACEVSFDTEAVLQQAMMVGRQGEDAAQNREYVAQLPANPVKLQTTILVDPTALQATCVEFARSIECEAQDALVLGFDGSLPENERWITVPEVRGRKVDLNAMWALVDESFGSGRFDEVCVPVEYIEPSVTLESLMVDKQLIASFSSKMSRDENRITNIRLACQSINGTVLQPGEEFSFNDVVGPRTAERGYKEAGVIVGGDRLDNGLGGGICQVSGTLFNAVVMSDLEIVTRYTHSYELSYLTRGRDATVDYGRKDFVFKNNSDTPVTIAMFIDEENLGVYAQVYGYARTDGITIDIRVETLSEPDPPEGTLYEELSTLNSGETTVVKARKGVVSQSYKVYYKDGQVLREEELFRDSYPAIQAKVYYSPQDSLASVKAKYNDN